MLNRDRADNLAYRVEMVVTEGAENLAQHICDAKTWPCFRQLQKLAREAAGVTADELEHMGETDDNNARYTLYWAELSNLIHKTLARAIDRMSF